MKVKELETKMLAARQAYHDYMDAHSRPMNAEEKQNYKSPLRTFEGEVMCQEPTNEPEIVEFNAEQLEVMQELETKMHSTYQAFVTEYQKIKLR